MDSKKSEIYIFFTASIHLLYVIVNVIIIMKLSIII